MKIGRPTEGGRAADLPTALRRLDLLRQRIEGRFIYYPDPDIRHAPKDAGIEYEEVWFEAGDGTPLHGWFVPGEEPFLLWCHGNAGNMSHRISQLAALRARRPVGAFMFDYRGYGRSGGSPTETGLYLDAHAALEALRARQRQDRIVYLGQSLGAAVATELALRDAPAGVILESGFTSLAAMSKVVYPWLPVSFALSTRFDSIRRIGRIESPILLLHGTKDDIVPVEMANRLYEAAAEPKRVVIFERARHDDAFVLDPVRYLDEFFSFLDSL